MTTKPPRQREGQKYPGGRSLRRKMAKIEARKSADFADKDARGHTRKAPGSA